MNSIVLKYGMTYEEAIAAIKAFATDGGDLRSKDLCNDNLASFLIDCYNEKFGLFKANPDNEDDGFWLNPERETELPIHKRESGIVYDLEWIRTNGFDFEEDCKRYIDDQSLDRFESPIVKASCVANDAYLFEYLVNNGYSDLLHEKTCPEDGDYCDSVIDWIWDELDLQSEEFSWYKNDDYDVVPAYANTALLLKMLIFYGCQKRGGFIVRVHSDLKISFPGPLLLH